jgi:hypothetical protein
MADSGNDKPEDPQGHQSPGGNGSNGDSPGSDAPDQSDTLDDLAAFLMHRTADPGVTDEERYRTFALVAAYQDKDSPAEIQQEMREAALKFAGHPDYRADWRPR